MVTFKHFIFILIITFVPTAACNNSAKLEAEKEMHRRESELFKKELALKEKEIELQNKEAERMKAENELLTQNGKLNATELYKLLKGSVFTIYTKREDESIVQGSAFVVDPTGIAISNYHVFENASDAIALNELEEKFVIGEVLEYDKELDYFIFRLAPSNSSFQYLNIANVIPEIGDECFAISNPEGLTNSLTKGVISGFRKNETYIQTDAEFTHGSSGAPLFNQKGEVVGITTSGIEGTNLNFAINIQQIPLGRIMNTTNSTSIVNSTGSERTSNIDVEEYLRNYFSVLKKEEFWKLNDIYADYLERYYHKFNVEKNWVINDVNNYKKKFKVNSVDYKIDWGSVTVYNSLGYTLVSVEMDYQLDRQEKSKPSFFHLKLFMKINSDGKIVSLYENILDRF